MARVLLNITALALVCFQLLACTDGGTDYRSSCGTVVDGSLRNPVDANRGEYVEIVSAPDATLVVVRASDHGEATLVLLHGLSYKMTVEERLKAAAFIESLGPEAVFFRAEENCTVSEGGLDNLIPGQLFAVDGRNFSEELLAAGLAEIDSTNRCKSRLLENCYTALFIEGEDL